MSINQPVANEVAAEVQGADNADSGGVMTVAGEPDASMCAVPARFAEIVRTVPPDHLAYVGADGVMTYAELDRQSNRLAGALLAQIVADCPPAAWVTTAALAAHSQAVLATLPATPLLLLDELPPASTATAVGDEISPQANAMVAFTSGTTGRPRGVQCTHAQLLAIAATYSHHTYLNQPHRLRRLGGRIPGDRRHTVSALEGLRTPGRARCSRQRPDGRTLSASGQPFQERTWRRACRQLANHAHTGAPVPAAAQGA